MAKIEDISAQSFQFTEVVTPTPPSSGRIKLYAKSDHGLYKQSSDGTETLLVPDTRYKGLRLAKQIILTGAAATIEFNTDSDGNALNSVLGGELLICLGANSSITAATVCRMLVNNVSTASYWTTGSAGINFFPIYTTGTLHTNGKAYIDILNQNVIINSDYTYKNDSGGSYGQSGGGMTTPQTAVTAIKLFLSAGTFPAGTVVEWHERG